MDKTKYKEVDENSGDSSEDSHLLREMAVKARNYVESIRNFPEISELLFADGVGGILALFLAVLVKEEGALDDYLWIVVGDLPSAYFVVDDAETPKQALEVYCELMEDWISAVLSNQDLQNVFPVKAEPTQANANMLLKRIAFIRNELLD